MAAEVSEEIERTLGDMEKKKKHHRSQYTDRKLREVYHILVKEEEDKVRRKNKRERNRPMTEDEKWDRYMARRQLKVIERQEEKRNRAAVQIQSRFRGIQARSHYASIKPPPGPPEPTPEELETNAAVRIQARARGYLARKSVAQRRQEDLVDSSEGKDGAAAPAAEEDNVDGGDGGGDCGGDGNNTVAPQLSKSQINDFLRMAETLTVSLKKLQASGEEAEISGDGEATDTQRAATSELAPSVAEQLLMKQEALQQQLLQMQQQQMQMLSPAMAAQTMYYHQTPPPPPPPPPTPKQRVPQKEQRAEELTSAFFEYDHHGWGILTKNDIRRMFADKDFFGLHAHEEEREKLADKMDSEGYGFSQIDLETFLKVADEWLEPKLLQKEMLKDIFEAFNEGKGYLTAKDMHSLMERTNFFGIGAEHSQALFDMIDTDNTKKVDDKKFNAAMYNCLVKSSKPMAELEAIYKDACPPPPPPLPAQTPPPMQSLQTPHVTPNAQYASPVAYPVLQPVQQSPPPPTPLPFDEASVRSQASQLFKQYQQSGFLTRKDVRKIVQEVNFFGIRSKKKEMDNLMAVLDPNGTGKVEEAQFQDGVVILHAKAKGVEYVPPSRQAKPTQPQLAAVQSQGFQFTPPSSPLPNAVSAAVPLAGTNTDQERKPSENFEEMVDMTFSFKPYYQEIGDEACRSQITVAVTDSKGEKLGDKPWESETAIGVNSTFTSVFTVEKEETHRLAFTVIINDSPDQTDPFPPEIGTHGCSVLALFQKNPYIAKLTDMGELTIRWELRKEIIPPSPLNEEGEVNVEAVRTLLGLITSEKGDKLSTILNSLFELANGEKSHDLSNVDDLVPKLAKFVKREDVCEDSKSIALGILRNLSADNESFQDTVIKHGVLGMCHTFLRSDHVDTRYRTAGLLNNISLLKVGEVIKEGLYQPLSEVIDREGSWRDVSCAASALWILAMEQGGITEANAKSLFEVVNKRCNDVAEAVASERLEHESASQTAPVLVTKSAREGVPLEMEATVNGDSLLKDSGTDGPQNRKEESEANKDSVEGRKDHSKDGGETKDSAEGEEDIAPAPEPKVHLDYARKHLHGLRVVLTDIVPSSSSGKEDEAANQEGDDGEYIMISYRWANQTKVKAVAELLKSSGYKIWMDVEDLQGEMIEQITKAIRKAKLVIPFLSKEYGDSVVCKHEALYSQKKSIPIQPVLLSPEKDLHEWVQFFLGDMKYAAMLEDKNRVTTEEGNELLNLIASRVKRESAVASKEAAEQLTIQIPADPMDMVKTWKLENVAMWAGSKLASPKVAPMFDRLKIDGVALDMIVKTLKRMPDPAAGTKWLSENFQELVFGEVLALHSSLMELESHPDLPTLSENASKCISEVFRFSPQLHGDLATLYGKGLLRSREEERARRARCRRVASEKRRWERRRLFEALPKRIEQFTLKLNAIHFPKPLSRKLGQFVVEITVGEHKTTSEKEDSGPKVEFSDLKASPDSVRNEDKVTIRVLTPKGAPIAKIQDVDLEDFVEGKQTIHAKGIREGKKFELDLDVEVEVRVNMPQRMADSDSNSDEDVSQNEAVEPQDSTTKLKEVDEIFEAFAGRKGFMSEDDFDLLIRTNHLEDTELAHTLFSHLRVDSPYDSPRFGQSGGPSDYYRAYTTKDRFLEVLVGIIRAQSPHNQYEPKFSTIWEDGEDGAIVDLNLWLDEFDRLLGEAANDCEKAAKSWREGLQDASGDKLRARLAATAGPMVVKDHVASATGTDRRRVRKAIAALGSGLDRDVFGCLNEKAIESYSKKVLEQIFHKYAGRKSYLNHADVKELLRSTDFFGIEVGQADDLITLMDAAADERIDLGAFTDAIGKWAMEKETSRKKSYSRDRAEMEHRDRFGKDDQTSKPNAQHRTHLLSFNQGEKKKNRKATAEEKKLIKKIFYKYDKHGSGFLGRKEIRSMVKQTDFFGFKATSSDIDRLIETMDKDGNGEIDLGEFSEVLEEWITGNSPGDDGSTKCKPPREGAHTYSRDRAGEREEHRDRFAKEDQASEPKPQAQSRSMSVKAQFRSHDQAESEHSDHFAKEDQASEPKPQAQSRSMKNPPPKRSLSGAKNPFIVH